MLRKAFFILSLLITTSAFACWKVEGSFAVDGETWKIHQKVEHNKEYIMPAGSFILKFTISPQDKKKNKIRYVVHEKKGTSLILITQGEEEDIYPDKVREIFAKGEEGQPNSIITVKLTNI